APPRSHSIWSYVITSPSCQPQLGVPGQLSNRRTNGATSSASIVPEPSKSARHSSNDPAGGAGPSRTFSNTCTSLPVGTPSPSRSPSTHRPEPHVSPLLLPVYPPNSTLTPRPAS